MKTEKTGSGHRPVTARFSPPTCSACHPFISRWRRRIPSAHRLCSLSVQRLLSSFSSHIRSQKISFRMPMELAYWDIRGLAQPIRLLLEYTGTEYTDKLFSCGEAPDYDKSCWFDIKNKLGMDFPNLPYLVDGERKVVQSNAIMRYIARKHNMCGETEDEQVRVDIMENQAMDFRNGFDTHKDGYLKTLPDKLQQFSSFLASRNWFAGDKITFVDFIMYELLDQHRMFDSKCLDAFDNLKKFLDRFEALDKIAVYMKSPKFIKNPVNNKMAKWGNK